MISQLLLASNNQHKSREFERLFKGVTVLMPYDVGIDFEFPENGDTFFANAWGKATELHHLALRPVIADDSGLCVAALGGKPGILSARYGAERDKAPLSAESRNEYLLQQMRGMTERDAYFVCCLVLVLSDARFFAVQETVSGVIAQSPRGTNGFGYDPLFVLPCGKTMAELADRDKDRVSHRGKAAGRITVLLREETEDGGEH
jgi:XTP/dITP diphosphohydrolase